MGFFGDVFSGISSIGSTIAREAADFGGGLIGGLFGPEVPRPSVKSVSDVPEALGALIGGGLRGGVTTALSGRVEKGVRVEQARRQPTEAARSVGTLGVEANPRTDTSSLIASFRESLRGGPAMATAPAAALPGGAQIQRAGIFGDLALPLIPQIGEFLFGEEGGGGMALPAAPGAAAGTIFRATPARLVARRMFQIVNPSTGNVVTYKNVGRPVLYSGDFAACKRVARVAAKARRRRGR